MARPRLHDDALRARLLDATSRAISRGGPDAVTVRDVATAAGTSASAVYSLFGGRDALLQAVGAEAAARFAASLAAAARTDDPGEDLLALGLAYRRWAVDEPHFYRVMFGTRPADEPAVASVTQDATFRVLRDSALAVLRAAGAPDADERAARAAEGLWALVHGLVDLELGGLLPGDAEAATARYESVLRAAGPGILRDA
ncbi:TetR/AcrR family transcriptional regulator [Cellulomonas sp. H30R-01]|uniref:TetR/AcrR family transcriptional regulator n=1 Tax=Cellulomonas sp. H30R-01 TaxID=2704467 RepID=UPI00138DBDC2|nr:TetR-like C-terminal domain-containing protein [Cellulomonas sp. H30R-01]QHT55432.1 TetR/AcrR family transcriptional regulator [Cellulomonas sp. H30R-01]